MDALDFLCRRNTKVNIIIAEINATDVGTSIVTRTIWDELSGLILVDCLLVVVSELGWFVLVDCLFVGVSELGGLVLVYCRLVVISELGGLVLVDCLSVEVSVINFVLKSIAFLVVSIVYPEAVS